MRIFITGGVGSVGFALAEHFARQGHTVVISDIDRPDATMSERMACLGNLTFALADIQDARALGGIMSRHGVDVAINAAAITADRRRALAEPGRIVAVNVAGAACFMHAAAEARARRVLHLSSVAIYGEHSSHGSTLSEEAIARPISLYGLTKLQSEEIVLHLGKLYDMEVQVGRLGACFGPQEHPTGHRDTLSPLWQVLQLAQAGQKAILSGRGMRDWLYINDAVTAIEALINTSPIGHPVCNIAAGFVWPVTRWCDYLASAFPAFTWDLAKQGEAANVQMHATRERPPMSIQRLCAETGFRPAYDIETAFRDFMQHIRPLQASRAPLSQG